MSTANITVETLDRARAILDQLAKLIEERDQILSNLHAEIQPYVTAFTKKIGKGKRNPVPLLQRVETALSGGIPLTTSGLAFATGVTESTMSTWVYKGGRGYLEPTDVDGRRGWLWRRNDSPKKTK